MTRLEFRSVLCALHNAEPWALAETCPSITEDHKRRMAADPVRFFLRADDEQAEALWGLMAPLTRVPLVMSDAPAETSLVYRHAAE